MSARSILILSLGLNLVLGTWLVAKLRRSAASDAALPAARTPAAKSHLVPRLTRSNRIEVTTNVVDAPRFRWSLLETNDFEAYVANLRGVGCPDATVRHLVRGEVEARYAELEADAEEARPFWETPGQRRARMTRVHRAQAAIEDERRALLRRLVGVDWSSEAERAWVTDDMACLLLGFLADEKAVGLMDAGVRLEKRMQAFRDDTDRIVIDTDEPRLEALLVEAKRALEAGLSPPEVEEAMLRGVNLVNSFMDRDGLIGVSLTGAELRRLTSISFRGKDFITWGLRTELDRNRHGESDDIEEFLNVISPEAEEEIHALHGEQRWGAYERSKDEAFREFAGAARRLELPLESTIKVYEIRRAAETAARELKANAEMAPERRRAALEAMRRETKHAITAALGATAAKEFFRDDQGWAHTAFGAKEAKQ